MQHGPVASPRIQATVTILANVTPSAVELRTIVGQDTN